MKTIVSFLKKHRYSALKILLLISGVFSTYLLIQENNKSTPSLIAIHLTDSLETKDIKTQDGNINRITAMKNLVSKRNTYLTGTQELGIAICTKQCTILIPPTNDRNLFQTYVNIIHIGMKKDIKKTSITLESLQKTHSIIHLTDKDYYGNGHTIIIKNTSQEQLEKKINSYQNRKEIGIEIQIILALIILFVLL